MLTWKFADTSQGMVLCKRHVAIAQVLPVVGGEGWEVELDIHHDEKTAPFMARSLTQGINVAEMWAAREGERLDREVASMLRGKRP